MKRGRNVFLMVFITFLGLVLSLIAMTGLPLEVVIGTVAFFVVWLILLAFVLYFRVKSDWDELVYSYPCFALTLWYITTPVLSELAMDGMEPAFYGSGFFHFVVGMLILIVGYAFLFRSRRERH